MPTKTPEKRAEYEAARKRSEQVSMRLTPEEATRLRRAAESCDRGGVLLDRDTTGRAQSVEVQPGRLLVSKDARIANVPRLAI